MKIIGGIDVGTSGCKLSLYDEHLNLIDNYYKEYDVLHSGGNHEINFNDIKIGVIDILKEATKEHKISAIGITSFGETFAMLDGDDNILAPSMLYTDPRGSDECAFLCENFGNDKLTLMTGVKPHPMYSIYKIMWHKNNNPELFKKCEKILLGEDYIIYILTGNRQIDYSLAARTGAFDINKKCWIEDILETAEISTSLLSNPVPTGSVAGTISEKIKNLLNIDYDITIVNGAHDQVAAMIGSGIFDATQAMDGTGTVECIPVILKKQPENFEFYDYGYSVVPYIDNLYACYAFSYTGGATLKWFRDNFAEIEFEYAKTKNENVYALLDKKVANNPTGILVLPHFAGAATPYMDNESKAAFIGVTLETTKYDIYKALMEGTSYEMLLNFNMLKSFVGEIKTIRATGGGALSDLWMQIKADILDMEIEVLNCKEIGAAGTAALTALAIGTTQDLKSCVRRMVSTRKTFLPNKEKSKIYSQLYKKYSNLYNSVKNL